MEWTCNTFKLAHMKVPLFFQAYIQSDVRTGERWYPSCSDLKTKRMFTCHLRTSAVSDTHTSSSSSCNLPRQLCSVFSRVAGRIFTEQTSPVICSMWADTARKRNIVRKEKKKAAALERVSPCLKTKFGWWRQLQLTTEMSKNNNYGCFRK